MPIVLKSGSLNLLEPSGPVTGLLYLYSKNTMPQITVRAVPWSSCTLNPTVLPNVCDIMHSSSLQSRVIFWKESNVVSGASTPTIDFLCHTLLGTEQPMSCTVIMMKGPVSRQGQSSSPVFHTVSRNFVRISTYYIWLTGLVG